MSIASEITRIKNNIESAYSAAQAKGATMPTNKNSENLANTINSIEGGSSIGIPREVSATGVYQVPSTNFVFSLPENVTTLGSYALAYAFYNNNFISSANLSNIINLSRGSYSMYHSFYMCKCLTSVNLGNLTEIGSPSALCWAFRECSSLTSIDLSKLTTVNAQNAMDSTFSGCTNLTSVNLSNLTTIAGASALSTAFNFCYNITSVDLSSLTCVKGSYAVREIFCDCTKLTSINLPNLKQIGSETETSIDAAQFDAAFNRTGIEELRFPNLEYIYCTGTSTPFYGTFTGNSTIKKFYFPKLKDITYSPKCSSTSFQGARNYIFSDCSSLTEIHFGAENEDAIKATSGYATLWGRGAGNATVYFDL